MPAAAPAPSVMLQLEATKAFTAEITLGITGATLRLDHGLFIKGATNE